MENWMQKFENGKEKTYEDILKDKLNRLLDLVDNSREFYLNDMVSALTNIVELYDKLQKAGYDFDEKDIIFRKKQLAELRYKKMKKEHMESKEANSWNEFEENETQEELEGEER